jgi:REP element-mobilizing transposase RayT
MPDHIHLLIQDEDLTGFVGHFKGRAFKAAREHRIEGPIWQRGFFDHALRSEDHLSEVARYIWANPVRTGLAKRPEEHVWSGSLVWPQWRDEYGDEDGRG